MGATYHSLKWVCSVVEGRKQSILQLKNTSNADELPESVIEVVGFYAVISSRKESEGSSQGHFINRGTVWKSTSYFHCLFHD